MSDLVGNPEYRFSQNEAHIMLAKTIGYSFYLVGQQLFSSSEPSGTQSELLVHPCSGARRRRRCRCRRQQCLNIFSSIYCLASQSQISCGASLGMGKESIYKWPMSHDHVGRLFHIKKIPLKIFFPGTRSLIILKLGMQHRRLEV